MTAISRSENNVSLIMQKADETDATIDVLEEDYPDVQIHDGGTFWRIDRDREIRVEMDRVAEELGRPMSLSMWLVVMTSFIGRAQTGDDFFLVTSEMVGVEGGSS